MVISRATVQKDHPRKTEQARRGLVRAHGRRGDSERRTLRAIQPQRAKRLGSRRAVWGQVNPSVCVTSHLSNHPDLTQPPWRTKTGYCAPPVATYQITYNALIEFRMAEGDGTSLHQNRVVAAVEETMTPPTGMCIQQLQLRPN